VSIVTTSQFTRDGRNFIYSSINPTLHLCNVSAGVEQHVAMRQAQRELVLSRSTDYLFALVGWEMALAFGACASVRMALR
jgi:hypothetical protein